MQPIDEYREALEDIQDDDLIHDAAREKSAKLFASVQEKVVSLVNVAIDEIEDAGDCFEDLDAENRIHRIEDKETKALDILDESRRRAAVRLYHLLYKEEKLENLLPLAKRWAERVEHLESEVEELRARNYRLQQDLESLAPFVISE